MIDEHTQGPWAIRLEGREEQEIIVRSTAQVPDEFDGEPYEPLIADLYRGGNGNIHDARLIAAAPELLEVLKAFSSYVRDEQNSNDGAVTYSTTAINHWAFLARAAIAKAEAK